MKIRTEAKIGIITILALALGYIGLNFLKGIDLFKNEQIFYVKFQHLNGVAKATPVMISGYKVGAVRRVAFEYMPNVGYSAVVTIAVDPEVDIPQGSRMSIRKSMLMGSELILLPKDVQPGYYASGDTIPSVEAPEDFMAVATEKVLPSVVETMPHITQTVARINSLLSDERVDSIFSSLTRTSRELEITMAKLNKSINDLPAIMGNVRTASSSFVSMGQHVETIKLDTIVSNLNTLTQNLRTMSTQLNSTQGTAGLLLNDPSLYNRLDSLATSADMLMKDLKANPKRYVHFSIF